MLNPDWNLAWPARAEWIARLADHMPPEARLIPDLLALVAEYGASFLLTWKPTGCIDHEFCPWRDIKPFSRIEFFVPWAEHISGIATMVLDRTIVDQLSDHTWHFRSPTASALSRAHDPSSSAHFKTELPRDAYVIYDMALHGAAAIKNTMCECQDPIALGVHDEHARLARITFRSDIF